MSLPKRLSALCLCLCLALGLSGCTPAVFGRWVLERSLRALSGAESQSEPAQAEGSSPAGNRMWMWPARPAPR